jgi:hypothetical protein
VAAPLAREPSAQVAPSCRSPPARCAGRRRGPIRPGRRRRPGSDAWPGSPSRCRRGIRRGGRRWLRRGVPCQANPMSHGSQGISVGFPVSSGAREPAPATSQLRSLARSFSSSSRRSGRRTEIVVKGRLEVREDDPPPPLPVDIPCGVGLGPELTLLRLGLESRDFLHGFSYSVRSRWFVSAPATRWRAQFLVRLPSSHERRPAKTTACQERRPARLAPPIRRVATAPVRGASPRAVSTGLHRD